MRPASAMCALVLAATIFMVACQGSNLTAPHRGLDLAQIQ
jgi:hypothetical protein